MSDIHNDQSTPTPNGDGASEPVPPLAIPLAQFAYASPSTETHFPIIEMRRGDALVDFFIGFAALCVFVPIVSILGALMSEAVDTPLGPLLGNVPLGIFFLLFVALVLIIRKQSARHVGLTIPSPWRFWLWLPISLPAIYAAAMFGGIIFTVGLHLFGGDQTTLIEDKMELFDMMPKIPVGVLIPFVFFVGLHEELLFRGFLLSRLQTATRSNVAAVSITAFLFGLVHFYQGPAGMVQTACIGAVLAIITIHARTIWPAILAHAFLDGVNITLMPWLQKLLTDLAEEASTSQPALLGG